MGYSTAQEIRDIRRTIREIQAGAKSATISSPSGQRSYTNHDLRDLYDRERDLLKRLAMSSRRKRTIPDFGETDGGPRRAY